MNLPKLVLLTNLKAQKISDDEIIITQKFIDGVSKYKQYWQGEISVFIEEEHSCSNNLDNTPVKISDLPFQVNVIDFDTIQEQEDLKSASLVLASVGFRQNHISKVCKSYNIPCVYVSEYSLNTRIQIINTATHNPIIRLRRYIWELSQELKQRRAIKMANGIQCNGGPTHTAYQTINSNPLLYFDSRITEDMLASHAEITEKTKNYGLKSPLRLLFSGRLIKMKGADHLLLVAQELKKLGINFEMFICGDGDLKECMQTQIQESGLSNSVKMLGVLDFKSELLPFAKSNADLFVCCHRQGDPSCTYLETMGCGIPIVGYANEAFIGVVEASQVGWPVEMNRPDRLAQKIAELANNTEAIRSASFDALEFAKLHTFEKTFGKRISHMKQIVASSEYTANSTAISEKFSFGDNTIVGDQL